MSTMENSDQSGYDLASRRQMEQEAQILQKEIASQLITLSGALDKGFTKMESTMDNWVGGSYLKKPMAWIALKVASRFVDSKRSFIEPDATKAAEDIANFLKLQVMIKTSKNLDTSPKQKAIDLVEPFKAFMDIFDFGEVREMIESATKKKPVQKDTDGEDQIDMQDYLGKMIPLAASLPAIISKVVNTIRDRIEKQTELAPDALIEVIAGLVKMIDGREIGELINDQYLVSRMWYIGSLMMGDGNTPGFQSIAREKLLEILPAIEPEVYGKMKIAKAENKAALKNALSDAMIEFPELTKKAIAMYPSLKNTEIRRIKKKLRILENLPEDELSDTIEEGINEFDTSELSELISSFLEVLNSVHSNKPDLISTVLSSIALSIDIDELETFSQEIVPEVVKAIKPAASVVMPSLINGLCDLLTPSPGEDSEELEKAVARLGNILNNGGAK